MKRRVASNAPIRWCILAALALIRVPPALAQAPPPTDSLKTGLRVVVTDPQQYPIPGATVSVYRQQDDATETPAATVTTDEHGDVAFPALARGVYIVRVEIAGFNPYTKQDVTIGSERTDLHAVLAVATLAENVSVQAPGGAATGLEAGPSLPAMHLERRAIQRLPLATARIDEALSIVPGVVRSGTGEISMKGATEQQSGLLVNGLDAVDPATGNFRLSLPVDSVEAVQVFLHPYTAEYGQFTGGLTKVETRAGGDRWHFELNDFLPDLRFVGHKIVGIAEDAPHLNLSGPLIDHRMYLSQSLSYTIAKRQVRGLDFPFNETRTDAQSYFSQLDMNLSPRRTDTFTIGYSPERTRFVGLDVFRPQPVTPNATQGDLVIALRDRYQMGEGLLDSALSVRRFNTSVWPQGSDDHTLAPDGERGNYFGTENRHSARVELFEVYTLPTKRFLFGTHDIKFGFDFNVVTSSLDYALRPVNIVRQDGTLAERIEFEPTSTIRADNRESVGFVQDRWAVRQNLSFDLGLRYENQRLADGQGMAPRAGFAWAPANDNATVIRGGIGLFFDKVPLNIRSFSQYPARIVTQYAPDGVTPIDRRRFTTVLVAAAAPKPFDTKGSEPKSAFVPENLTWNVQLDQRVAPSIALRVNYINSSTDSIYIVNPQLMADGSNAIVLQSTGRSSYRALETTVRIQPPRGVLYLTYVRSRARGDLNDFNSSFGDFGAPVIRQNQFSQLPVDVPHRFLTWGTFALPRRFSIAPIVEVRSGFPYSVRDAQQCFVGIRNSDETRFPRFVALDLEAAKELQITKKYAVRLSVRGFNVTNHFNPRDVRANLGDPGFGHFLASYRRYFTGGFDIIF